MDTVWNGKEDTLVHTVLDAWAADEAEDKILDRLCALGLNRQLASRALDTIASASSTAVLFHAGLRPDQVTSDLDDDPLFTLALELAREAVAGEEPTALRSLTELAGALKSEDAYDRQDAVYELGQTSNQSAAGLLIAALSDADNYVRLYAVQALAELGSRQAVGALCGVVDDDADRSVVTNALKALARIGDRAALPTLVAATRHADPAVRYDSLTALGDLGDAGAVPAVEALLKDDTRPVELDEDGNVTQEAQHRICDYADKILRGLRA